MTIDALIAHLLGDYVLQSDWMARNKTKRWWPALVHGFFYTLPFLALTLSPAALLVIGGSHAALDHYRVARRVVWLRNFIGPTGSNRPLRDCTETGSSPTTPAGIATAVLIVVDNTLHLIINAVALRYLGSTR